MRVVRTIALLRVKPVFRLMKRQQGISLNFSTIGKYSYFIARQASLSAILSESLTFS